MEAVRKRRPGQRRTGIRLGGPPDLKEMAAFLENAPVALNRLGRDGTILWANEAELKLLGYTQEEYVGRNITEFHTGEAGGIDILHRLKEGEDIHEYEALIRARDGSVLCVAITANVCWDNGQFIHALCLTQDITEQKRATQRLAAVVESSDDAIITKDLDGIIRSWNQGAERIFAYTREEAIGKPITILAGPEGVNEMSDILDRVPSGEHVAHYQAQRRTKDGRVLTVSFTVSPIRDASGAIIGSSVIARDTTEQKHAAELQQRLAAIVESSDDAIISKDLNGIIRSWNQGAERIFGYTEEEVLGKPVTILAVPERVEEIPNILERIRRGERVDHYVTKRRTKDGRVLAISLTVSPIRDAFGTIIGASKIARDITDRVQAEEALRRANAALRRSNADLEQFAYSASHDLQEPLRMVGTYSEMIRRKFGGQLGEVGDEYIRYTVEGARRMQQLLKDLLAYTQASMLGETPTADVDANEVLEQAMTNLHAAITGSGTRITKSDLPMVRVHGFQLEQVFQNLIGNAIRYRRKEAPEIHIAAKRSGSEWCFSVRDNGIGIEPKFKETIFEMFKRLHSSADHPGTGMGLAICRRIIERAEGRIWVESEPGRGSTFFFTLPASDGQ